MPGLITDTPDQLKIKYPPMAVNTMLQEDTVFRPRLKRSLPAGAKITSGYEIRIPAKLNASQNVAQIADGGNFPIPKDPTARQFIFKPTIFAADYQVGGMLRYVANNSETHINGGAMNERPEETMSNLGKFIESTYVGTDGTGIRSYVESDPGASQIKLKNPWGTRLLAENMYISERQSAGGAVRSTLDLRAITAIDHDTRIITYGGGDDAGAAIPDDPIYVVSELALAGATLATIHANGLRGQIDDGTNAQFIHTLDRTAAGNGKLKSLVSQAGQERRNIGESLLIGITHDAARRSKKRASTLIMGEGQVEKYIEHLAPQKRFVSTGGARNTGGTKTGYMLNELSFVSPSGAMDFMLSFDALPGEIYGVAWDALFFYSALDAQWLSGSDMQSLHLLPGTNGATHRFSFGAFLVSIENWGTDFPLAHFVIRDLKDRLLGD